MERGPMRVTEILELYQKAQREKRVPAKPQKLRGASDFELIFKEKCEELKDGRETTV